jgi:beta-glucosidase
MKKILILVIFLLATTSMHLIIAQDQRIELRVDSVLRLMTLQEKIGQLVLYTSDWDITGPVLPTGYMIDIRNGSCGNIFNAHSVDYVRKLQKTAVEDTRLHIPLLFGYDVIHGYKTIFPISLGEAASWDLFQIQRSAHVAASEAAAAGVNWTYAPMCDVTVDPRWGRVSEGAGEDPYLGAQIAAARVHGFQGLHNNLADTSTVLACIKHFAGYGAPSGGRDYNTVDMSERTFRDVYLPPYLAAIKAGAMSIMTAFNELNGVPCTENKWLLTDVLRNEAGFQGFVVSDYNSVGELVNHGVAVNEKQAGELAINAGLDMDMQSTIYHNYLQQLVKEKKVSETTIDEAVRRVLRVKFMLGLFDNPYLYCNNAREKRVIKSPENMKAAFEEAQRSLVLLKNNHQVLPLRKGERLAVIGQLATSSNDLLGSWRADGDTVGVPSLLDELRSYNGSKNIIYAQGCKKDGYSKKGFPAAMKAAQKANKIVLVIGEDCDLTGEASSRTNIKIPGVQTDLLAKLTTLHKPIVVVLMNGRPLDLSREDTLADAILETWYAGSRGGKAITSVLYGEYNPSGKLPITFPRCLGQVPLFYYEKNSGRPIYLPDPKYKSRYLDCSNTPLFPFGFGLSYTTFHFSNISLSSDKLTAGDSIQATITVTNTGKREGEEVVQLYVRDLVADVTRPVKQLKGFQKIALLIGESKKITFTITPAMLSFYRLDMTYGTEPSKFDLFIGDSSDSVNHTSFTLTK